MPLMQTIQNRGKRLLHRGKHALKRRAGYLKFLAFRRLGTPLLSDPAFLKALSEKYASISEFEKFAAQAGLPNFFIHPQNKGELVGALEKRFPGIKARTLSAADKICDKQVRLFGTEHSFQGGRFDWHLDFLSGHRFDPSQYSPNIKPALYPGGFDIKTPWELSRCQHFAWLGQAYWFSGDEKYAREFAAQVEDWIEHNPYQQGVNWVCTMDIAIRAVNWLWGYAYFSDSPSISPSFRSRFMKSLLLHGRHIYRHPEKSNLFTSNHYISNLVGLVYLGFLLPFFKEAKTWREAGVSELVREMEKQVYPDGVDYEASTCYHRLVSELFLYTALLAARNQRPFPAPFLSRLEKMLEYIQKITKPNGRVPQIGDNDSGRLLRLKTWEGADSEWTDHRGLLALGSMLFEREDFAASAGGEWEEAAWFFGAAALNFPLAEPGNAPQGSLPGSAAFPAGGVYIMRDQELYLCVDAGMNGQNGNGGHAHNDLLSFELHARGTDWIVDPGSFVYTLDYDARNQFRSTAFHNTIQIDGQEINRFDPADLFRVLDDARIKIRRWQTCEQYDFLDAEHAGYTRLPYPAVHRRQIFFDRRAKTIVLRDLIIGKGRHDIKAFFQVGTAAVDRLPGCSHCIQLSDGSGTNLFLIPLLSEGLEVKVVQGRVSPGYGQAVEGKTIVFEVKKELPAELVTVFAFALPDPESRPDPSIYAQKVLAEALKVMDA